MGDLLARLQSALGAAYRVREELGGGGMGRVFVATETALDRPVVIKVLPPDLAPGLSVERFRREIQLAAKLQHPHIVPLLSAGAVEGLLYYTMPLIEGESLRTRLARQGELPIPEAVRILRDVADALAYAHEHALVHRDIKPDNVLVSGKHALVTDFGVSKALSTATGTSTLTSIGVALGTPAYMAPEQAAADPNTDHRADIYALGVVAYELLTGHPPFAGLTAQQVLAAHATQAPVPVTQSRAAVPPALGALVMRCLEKHAADRPQTAAEVLEALEAMATPSGGATPTATVPVSSAPAKPVRRRLVLGTVVVVLLVAGIGAITWTRSRGTTAGTDARRPMLVVLPFRNLGATADQYFTDGVTEEVTTRLSQISGIGVIGRASATGYQNTDKTLQQISRELGVQYVLQGTVRTDRGPSGAGQARVAPELIRVADATNLWAEAYTASLAPGAIFGVQAKIAEQVAQALNVTLLATEREAVAARPTENREAYDAYLRGNDYLQRGAGQNWEAQRIAEQMFERATQLDPRFASAYAGLAKTNMLMFVSSYDLSMTPHLTQSARLARARQLAERALRLDPDLPRAIEALAGYYHAIGDSTRAEAQYALWLRAAPHDPMAIAFRGRREAARGEWTEAATLFDRALRLDPRSVDVILSAGGPYCNALKFRECESYLDRWISLAPDLARPYVYKAWSYVARGDTVSARKALNAGTASVGLANLLVDISRHSFLMNLVRIFPDYGTAVRGLSMGSFGTDTVDYIIVKAMAFRLQPERAMAYYDSVRAWHAAWIRAEPDLLPDNLGNYVGLAWAYAGLGRKREAIDEITTLEQRGAKLNATQQGLVAEVYVMCDEADAAIDRLRKAIHTPFYTPAVLRLDPVWDPLRANPRFQVLLKEQ